MGKSMCSVLLSVVLVGGLSASAYGATALSATLTGGQEVPPRATSATGTAIFVLNDTMTALTYSATIFGLDFTGTQTPDPADNLIAAHIHAPAVLGVNAPGIVFGFFGAPFNDNAPNDVGIAPFAPGVMGGVGGMISGKWDLNEGNNTTLAAQRGNILAGLSYINFHTTRFPAGEIRGQILLVPEPSVLLLLGAGLAGLAAGTAWRRHRRK